MPQALLPIFQLKASGNTTHSSPALHKQMQGANINKPLPPQGSQLRAREGKKGNNYLQ